GRNDAEGQARYCVLDLALDPLPYGGVNSTLEALDMSVPVVTLRGRKHGERTSYSILANLGVTQTVAQSGSEYVAIAARLASDRAFHDEVVAAIKAGLASSALTDMPRHTRALEAAYQRALALAGSKGRWRAIRGWRNGTGSWERFLLIWVSPALRSRVSSARLQSIPTMPTRGTTWGLRCTSRTGSPTRSRRTGARSRSTPIIPAQNATSPSFSATRDIPIWPKPRCGRALPAARPPRRIVRRIPRLPTSCAREASST